MKIFGVIDKITAQVMREILLERQLGFNPDKISGAFNHQQIYRHIPVKETWDNVYAQKEQSRSLIEEPETEKQEIITEKHLMYYHAFRNLGFFNFPESEREPIILQAGVGHGKTLQTVISKIEGIKPMGIDISFFSLIRALNNGLTNVIQGDIFPLPFARDSIDAVFEVGVVEHLYSPDPFMGRVVDRCRVVESFQELHRVLKIGGKAGFIQPSRHSILPFSKKIDETLRKWNMGFQEDFGLNDFCQLVNLGGFSDICFSVLQAPDDFPKRIRYGDRILKSVYTVTGQYRKMELTGALFTVVATKS